jgi:hypothetical protein
MTTEGTPADLGLSDGLGLAPERAVRPALGYKHHAERVRNTGAHMEATAEFIEAQNAEIEYLYAALQRVRNRVVGSRRNNATAWDVLAIADAAMKYEA